MTRTGAPTGPSIPLSFLDLAPVAEGSSPGQALRNARDLAQLAERLGYRRYWLAEHHSMPGIASAATSVAIGFVAEGTTAIRVGAGGIMLPNHAPLVIAEQFGTLAALYPGRIDLGLGRAPGTDQATAHALRRTLVGGEDRFPQDVVELQAYFEAAAPGQVVRAVPGEGMDVPLWILGSSLFGAHLAAALGLPYAFASHFAPAALMPALAAYRERFRPSAALAKPYAMVAMNVIAAETDEEARRLATSLEQAFLNLRRGRPGLLPAPVAHVDMTTAERAMLAEVFSCSVAGSEATVRDKAAGLIARTGADELMITSQIFDHGARRRSLEIAARALAGVRAGAPATEKEGR
jgi:luciferase family oxidoreductase group 1